MTTIVDSSVLAVFGTVTPSGRIALHVMGVG
jgi:hypothetical protein